MGNHPKGRSWPNTTGIATKQDAIMTPAQSSIKIINHFKNQISGICLDPCKGEGSFYDNLPEPKLWAEMGEGICDFDKNIYRGSKPIKITTFLLTLTFSILNSTTKYIACFTNEC